MPTRNNTVHHPPRVKICCISSIEEAHLAITLGAAALGLVSHMPSGPGVIPDVHIAEIAAAVPPPVATFLLTSRRDADAIAEQHATCRTTTIQLVDAVEPAELVGLRRLLPHVKLVQVIHVMGEAIRAVEPFGLDLCSRVRGEDGKLSAGKLEAFMEAVGRSKPR